MELFILQKLEDQDYGYCAPGTNGDVDYVDLIERLFGDKNDEDEAIECGEGCEECSEDT